MSFVADAVEDVGDFVGDTVDFVGDALEDTWDVVTDAADWTIDTASGIVQGALDDPIKTIAQVAAVATGNAYLLPYISAADVAIAGGDIKDIAKSAAVSYAAGQIAQGVAGSTGITVDDAGIPLLPADVAATGSGIAGEVGSQIAGNTAGGAAGNAFATAVMGGDLDQILNASITGGLGAGTNAALKELGVPKDLTPVIGGAVAGGAGAALNGGDVMQSILRGGAIGGVNSALNMAGREVKALYDENKSSLANYFKTTEEYKTTAKDANEFLNSTYKPLAEQVESKYNELISVRDEFEGEKSAYDNLMAQFEENKRLYGETKDGKYADAANALVDEIEAAAEKANSAYAKYEEMLPTYEEDRSKVEDIAAQYTEKYEKAIELDTAAKQALESYETTYGQYVGKAIEFNQGLADYTNEVTKSFVQNTGEVPTAEKLNQYINSGKDVNEIVSDIQQSDLGQQWSDIKGQEQELRSLFDNDLVQRVSKGYGMPYVTEGDEGTPAQLQRWSQYEQKLNEALQNNDKDAAVQATFNYYKDLAENGNPLFRVNEDGSVDNLVEGVRMYAEPIGVDENDFPIYYEQRDDIKPDLASDNAIRNLFNFANEEGSDSDSWLSSWLGQGGVGDIGSATPMGIVSGPGGLFQTPNGEAFSLIEVGGKKYMQDPENPLSVYEVTPEIQTAIDTAEYIKTNDVNKDGKVDLQDAIKANQTGNAAVNDEQIVKLNEDLQKALQQNGNNTNAAIQQLASQYGTSTDELKQVLESVGTKINEGNQTTQSGLGALSETVKSGTAQTTTSIDKLNEDFKKALEVSGNNTKEAIDKMAQAYGTTTEQMTGQLKGALGEGFTTLGEQISQGNQTTQSGLGTLGGQVEAGTKATTGAILDLGNTLNEAIKTGDTALIKAVEGGNQDVIKALSSGNIDLAKSIANSSAETKAGLGTLGQQVEAGTAATTGAIGNLGTTLTGQNTALQEAVKTGNQGIIDAVKGGNQGVIDALNSGNAGLAQSIADSAAQTQSGLGTLGQQVEAGTAATTGAIGELGSTLTGQNTALQEAVKTGNQGIIDAVKGGNQGVIDALNGGNTTLAASIASGTSATTGAIGELGSTLTGQNEALQNAIATGDQNIVNAVNSGNQGVIDALGSGNTSLAAAIAAGTLATTSGLGSLGSAFSGLRSSLTANNAATAALPKDLGAGVVTGKQAELGSLNTFENAQQQQAAQAAPKPDDIYFDYSDVQRAAEGGQIQHNPQFFSEGGLGTLDNRYVRGEGDGTSDSVPAMLASGEFVIPADVVSGLGNGDNNAGASVLDEFMKAIRVHKRAADPSELPEDSKGPLAYLQEAMTKVRA